MSHDVLSAECARAGVWVWCVVAVVGGPVSCGAVRGDVDGQCPVSGGHVASTWCYAAHSTSVTSVAGPGSDNLSSGPCRAHVSPRIAYWLISSHSLSGGLCWSIWLSWSTGN
jgi:hypothetical protein